MRLTSLSIVGLFGLLTFSRTGLAQENKTAWQIRGDLNEACTCSVPCSCNFGESPSPHAFCYALFSLGIEQGHYGETDLSGLHLAGANGAKGCVFYVDERATREQAEALKRMAQHMWETLLKANGIKDPKKAPPEYRLLGFRRAKIVQEVGEHNASLKIGTAGSYENTYIVGMDGKTPVVVENNYSWNIQHGIKGKTHTLQYKDGFGNHFEFKGTNANQGKFDWSDTTPIYFR
jgi:hypothetical protein